MFPDWRSRYETSLGLESPGKEKESAMVSSNLFQCRDGILAIGGILGPLQYSGGHFWSFPSHLLLYLLGNHYMKKLLTAAQTFQMLLAMKT